MPIKVIEKKIKPQTSFFRLSDGSWCEIATRWGKGPRTGLIVCRGKDKAIPQLTDFLAEEGKRRKYEGYDTYSEAIIGEEKLKFSKKVLSKLRRLK